MSVTKELWELTAILRSKLAEFHNVLISIGKSLVSISEDIRIMRQKEYPDVVLSSDVVSIQVKGPIMKTTLPFMHGVKAGTLKKHVAGAKLSSAPFGLVDGATPGTYTVVGKNEAGETVALDGLATLAVTSDNPAVVVGPVAGMTVPINAAAGSGAGAANVSFTITMNDPSTATAPNFTATDIFNYSGGKITGIDVQGP